MDVSRIVNYCNKKIQEEVNPEKKKALADVLNFIQTAEQPENSEIDQILEIFQRHHIKHFHSKHPFTKDDRKEVTKLIVQINLEMETNPEQYDGVTIYQFFELFMSGLDSWWLKNQFSLFAFNKHFRVLLGSVKSKNNPSSGGKGGGSGKLSYVRADR